MRNLGLIYAASFFLFFCVTVLVATSAGNDLPMWSVQALFRSPWGLTLLPLAVVAVLAGWRLGSRIGTAGQRESDLRRNLGEITHAYEELRSEYTAQIEKRSQIRKELLSANKRLNILLQSAREVAIIGTSEEGKITFFNRGAEQLLGYNAKEMLNAATPECFHAETELTEWRSRLEGEFTPGSDGYGIFANWALMRAQGKRECSFIRKDGRSRIVEESVVPMRNREGSIVGYLHVAMDITGRKRMEEKLLHAKRSAETSSQAKSQFLANMGHELRTPLNAIIGYSDMLIEDSLSEENKECADDLSRINRAGHKLLAMINEILDLSRMEAGQVEAIFRVTEVAPLTRQLESQVLEAARESGNEFCLSVEEELPRMYTDPEKLRKALQYLLDNAVKFTSDGTITLAVTQGSGATGSWVEFSVKDTGVGMCEEQLEDIFEPFTQTDARTTRKHGGIGLGLSMAKEFCKLLGAELTATSVPDKGSQFSVRVPVAGDVAPTGDDPELKSRLANAGAALESSPDIDGPLVLLLDQEKGTVEKLTPILSEAGYRVASSAFRGEFSDEVVARLQPHALIHRYVVPGTAAWDRIKRLKNSVSLSDSAFIIVDEGGPFDLRIVLDTPDFESKPMEGERLDRLLDKHGLTGTNSPVLVIDDDAEARRILGTLLGQRGLQALFAENGKAALKVLEEQDVNLVFLDVMMPVMNGFEFLSRFRELPDAASTAVVVLTSRDLSSQEREQLSGCVETFAPRTDPGLDGLVTYLNSRRHGPSGGD